MSKRIYNVLSALASSKPEEWQLFAGTPGSTATTVSLTSGRSIADFETIVFIIKYGGYNRGSIIVPVTRFKDVPIELNFVDSANVQRWCDVTYASDTSVKIQTSSNMSGATLYIYGLGTSHTY